MYYIQRSFPQLAIYNLLMISHGLLGLLVRIGPPGIFDFVLMNKQRGMRGRCPPAGNAALTLFICLLFVTKSQQTMKSPPLMSQAQYTWSSFSWPFRTFGKH